VLFTVFAGAERAGVKLERYAARSSGRTFRGADSGGIPRRSCNAASMRSADARRRSQLGAVVALVDPDGRVVHELQPRLSAPARRAVSRSMRLQTGLAFDAIADRLKLGSGQVDERAIEPRGEVEPDLVYHRGPNDDPP